MEQNENRALRNICITLGIIAAVALALVTVYHTEQRVRRLCYRLEQRLRTKPARMEVEL